MQCPNCQYTVTGRHTGFPSSTHCCQACEGQPGTHGPRCARHLSPYAEHPRVCPACRRFAVTGVSSTHCCRKCAQVPDEHGESCHRRPPHWDLSEEYSAALRHRLLRHGAAGERCPSRPSSPPALGRCAYVTLLYGSDAEYALGALLVASSLRRAGVQARVVLLHTADTPPARLQLLRELYDEVRLIRDPVRVPHDSPLSTCSRDFAHSQFLKLHLFELELEKVLYLDCDVLVRRNLDDLFGLDAPAAMERIMAMPPHGARLPNRVTYGGRRIRGIQGGVMLLAPDMELFSQMREEVEDRDALRHWGYQPSIGNEQDYLTWRYCDGLAEEDGHASVWTHLGCEYNYEVHPASTYFTIGRERWLWLDYELDAAVLHFSAPFRKRAKRLLHGTAPSAQQQQRQSPGVEDPRLAFAHAAWDAEVEQLRAVLAARGYDLTAWLGEGHAAHSALYAVIERTTGRGMEIRQLGPEDDTSAALQSSRLVFEAFTANCAEDLVCFPPGFSPGPPWGACFWARGACEEARVQAGGRECGGSSTGTGARDVAPAPGNHGSGSPATSTLGADSSPPGKEREGGAVIPSSAHDAKCCGDGGRGCINGGIADARSSIKNGVGRFDGSSNRHDSGSRHAELSRMSSVNGGSADCGGAREAGVTGGSTADGGADALVLDVQASERRAHPGDSSGRDYTLQEFLAYAKEWGMQPWYGERLWREAGDEPEEHSGAAGCICAERPRPGLASAGTRHQANGSRAAHGEALEEVGAWLRLCRAGDADAEQWAFGLAAEPPHFPDCPLWRQVSAFRVKVVSRGSAAGPPPPSRQRGGHRGAPGGPAHP